MVLPGWLYWKAGLQTILTPSPTFMCWPAMKIPIRSCLLLYSVSSVYCIWPTSTNVPIICPPATDREQIISSQDFLLVGQKKKKKVTKDLIASSVDVLLLVLLLFVQIWRLYQLNYHKSNCSYCCYYYYYFTNFLFDY